MIIITIIAFLIVFSILIVVHEIGHYIAARLSKVKVEEFGLGLPPRAVGKTSKKTGVIWSLNWIPLGGFVRMKGQDDFSLAQSGDEDSFSSKSRLARACILISGVLMNYLLAVLLLAIGFAIGIQPLPGSTEYEDQAFKNPAQIIISEIDQNSIAQKAGFQIQDIITDINGTKITTTESLQKMLQQAKAPLEYTIQRKQETLKFQVMPDKETHLTGMKIDALIKINPVKMRVDKAIIAGFQETNRLAIATVKGLGALVVHIVQKLTIPEGVAGPVGIAGLVNEAAQHGLMAVIQLTALLSISLAIINIMPFPALDGGRLLFIVFEILAGGRKVPEKIESIIHLIGFFLVLGLILAVTWNDIVGLF
ncbi:MAG: M50 family metallopeptidase [Patescibacteria group bacterium]|nr:M50 family metallopeptidase [Patescibacteria group bacterium]